MSEALGDTPRITALRPTQRDPNRSTVKVDGKAVGTLSNKLIEELGLTVTTAWTDTLAQQLAEALLYDKAFRAATRRLARRAMSRGMIRRKLRELDHPPDVIEKVLDRLDELGLIDDRAFGEALIREQTRGKPAGPMLLKQKLFAKGLDAKLIDELVRDATDDPDQQRDVATDFARKKLRSMQHLPADAQKRRLYGQLARRGFTPDAIRDAMDAVLRDDGDGYGDVDC